MQHFPDYGDEDPELADLRAQDRWERRRQARLARNPDCRDPDHPGCERCQETEDKGEEE